LAVQFVFVNVQTDKPVTTGQSNVDRAEGNSLGAPVDVCNGVDKGVKVHVSFSANSRLNRASKEVKPAV
jgi:hypothetical protein